MKEFNNRQIANKHAEYITGKELRRYLARKVEHYTKKQNASVFDGAAGSGQLEEFIQPNKLHAVEIQSEACRTLRDNYPQAIVSNMSFFQYDSDFQADAVCMNPPYSLKFKEQTDEDKTAIQTEFPWKKSGVVDDVFMLKAMKYTKRFGFFIMFPGITYRAAERKMREIIGTQLIELNEIRGAFEDTPINVVFIVLDKQKTSKEYSGEVYDCKRKKTIWTESNKLTDDFAWQIPREEIEKEVIDIDAINNELDQLALDHLENHLRSQLLAINFFDQDIHLLAFISKAYDILNRYEVYYNFGVTG